jgi:hypothetical protein
MPPFEGILLVAAGATVLLATWVLLRHRLSGTSADALTALAGVLVGVGGLLLLDDVGLASWLLTPPFLAAAGVAHRRALFAGAGPLRI